MTTNQLPLQYTGNQRVLEARHVCIMLRQEEDGSIDQHTHGVFFPLLVSIYLGMD